MKKASTQQTQNVQQLRSYLGLIHYYDNFLSNISSLLASLHELTRLDTEWKWGAVHMNAFEQSKALPFSSKVLAHYDPQLPIIVSSDASAYSIGSVLSHRMQDGNEKPVAFASRSLSPAENKYPQLEKEALALIFGVTKFHKYLCGRSFTLQSDHRPLLGLLKQDRVISAMASAHTEMGDDFEYEYRLEFMPGSRISHADCMSRLSLPDALSHVPVPQEVVLELSTLDETQTKSRNGHLPIWCSHKCDALHRIHIDYAGPFEGRMLLIIVDAHIKFIDAHIVLSATTSVTLTKFRQTFSLTGLPHTIVSDNGSCFTSDEFEQFCCANGIKHVRCSPYHPSRNGAAERAAQTMKFGLHKTKGNLDDRLYTLPAWYRVTPQVTTGRAPAEFTLKTPPHTRFDLLR